MTDAFVNTHIEKGILNWTRTPVFTKIIICFYSLTLNANNIFEKYVNITLVVVHTTYKDYSQKAFFVLVHSITKTVQVTQGRKYFPRGPHTDQSWVKNKNTKNSTLYISTDLWRGRDSNLRRAARSGNRIPVLTRIGAPVQTGPGPHPASCTMRIALLSRG